MSHLNGGLALALNGGSTSGYCIVAYKSELTSSTSPKCLEAAFPLELL